MLTIQAKNANFVQSPYGKVSDLSVDYDDITSLLTDEADTQLDYLSNQGKLRRTTVGVNGTHLFSYDVSAKRGKRLFLIAPGRRAKSTFAPSFSYAYWTFFLKQLPTVDGSYSPDDYISSSIDGNVTQFDGDYPPAPYQPWVQSFVIPDDASYFAITIYVDSMTALSQGKAEFKVYIEK